MNPQQPIADAMLVVKDLIHSIGQEADIQRNFDVERNKPQTDVIEYDLKGQCILPGFIDTHMHPIIAIYYKTQMNLAQVRSYEALKAIIQDEDRRYPSSEWLFGFDLMEDLFTDPKERFFPERFHLDHICAHRPLVILRHDGHICAVNTAGLQKIGIDKSNWKQKKPDNGEIRVDANGEPTGILTENATSLAVGDVSIPSYARVLDAARMYSRELASFGITTCGGIIQLGEEGPAGKLGSMELSLFEVLLKENTLAQDYVLYMIGENAKKILRARKSLQKINPSGLSPNKCVVAGMKRYADGSFGAHTAALEQPFTDFPSPGFMVYDEKIFYPQIKDAFQSGLHIAIHAIGDLANKNVVALYTKLLSEDDYPIQPPSERPRLRIEHASMLAPEILPDIAKTGIILCCQPAFIDSEYTWLETRLGPERIKITYPFRSILDAGVILAGASDAPIESTNVLKAIKACVTRNGFVPEQCISVEEALKVFTINAAYALGQEKLKGSLEAGKHADFIILDSDPRNVKPDQIPNIKIVKTYSRGIEI